MSVRKEVADKLSADNPTFIVKAHPVTAPDGIPAGKVWVNIYRENFVVADNNGHITHNLKVSVAIPKSNSDIAEDELDTAVDAVMLTLESLTDVYWSEASRVILGDKYESYEISLQAIRPQVYKSQLLTNS